MWKKYFLASKWVTLQEGSGGSGAPECTWAGQLVAFLWWRRARCQLQVKGHRVQISHPLGVSVYSPYESAPGWFAGCCFVCRERNPVAQNIALTVIWDYHFPPPTFSNSPLTAPQLRKQSPDGGVILDSCRSPSFCPHTQLHLAPHVSQAFSALLTCLSHPPSLLSWSLSTLSLCIPPGPAGLRSGLGFLIPRLPRFSSPSFLSFFLPVGISRALAAVASPALYSFSAAPVSPPATWFPPEAVLLDCIWRRLASCSEKTNTGLQVRHHIFAKKTPSSDNCAQGWLK